MSLPYKSPVIQSVLGRCVCVCTCTCAVNCNCTAKERFTRGLPCWMEFAWSLFHVVVAEDVLPGLFNVVLPAFWMSSVCGILISYIQSWFVNHWIIMYNVMVINYLILRVEMAIPLCTR